jgi:hypothetical protein
MKMEASSSKRVAVVVPVSNRAELTPSEMISLRHLRRHLDHYDKYLVAPEGLDLALDGFRVKRFPPGFFGSAENYKRMVLSQGFYEAFADYEYMLTYHLDALVFSDHLLDWCDRGYDLVGPPWLAHPDSPIHGTVYEGKVGNTGFCLKKVQTFLDLFGSKKFAPNPLQRWRRSLGRQVRSGNWYNLPSALGIFYPSANRISADVADWQWSEERFLLTRSAHYLPGFRTPSVDEALEFGFEVLPRHCYELNGNRLPFGCHAWERYDPAFWEPFLIREESAFEEAPGGFVAR